MSNQSNETLIEETLELAKEAGQMYLDQANIFIKDNDLEELYILNKHLKVLDKVED